MGEQLDDPNREAVGLAPIWSGTDAPPPDEGEGEGEGEAQREPKAPKAPKAPKHAAPGPGPVPSEDDATGAT
jgi:hypothetical protein